MLYHQSVLLPDTSCWRQRTNRPERHWTSMIAVKIIRYSTIVLSLLTNCMLIRQFRCPQLSKLLKVRLPFLFFDGPGGGRDFTPMTGRVCDDLMVQPWWVGWECRHRNWWVSDHFAIVPALEALLDKALSIFIIISVEDLKVGSFLFGVVRPKQTKKLLLLLHWTLYLFNVTIVVQNENYFGVKL